MGNAVARLRIDNRSFNTRFRYIRYSLNLRIQDVAIKSGIKLSRIRKLEQSTDLLNEITYREIQKLSSLFNMSIEEFINFVDVQN